MGELQILSTPQLVTPQYQTNEIINMDNEQNEIQWQNLENSGTPKTQTRLQICLRNGKQAHVINMRNI
jgi:hypothetical protein